MYKRMLRPEQLRVLILAPTGQDAVLIERALTDVKMSSMICRTLEELNDALVSGAGAVLLAQEALHAKAIDAFVRVLQAQPPWSDIPLHS